MPNVLGSAIPGVPMARMAGYSRRRQRSPIVVLVLGVIGAVVVAVGFHLFAGGLLDEAVSSFGPPLAQTCTGALCKVGVASGVVGIIAGAVVAIVGFGLRRA
jgi:hypothetical protein